MFSSSVLVFSDLESPEKKQLIPKETPSVPVETSQPLTTRDSQGSEGSADAGLCLYRLEIELENRCIFIFVLLFQLLWGGNGVCI